MIKDTKEQELEAKVQKIFMPNNHGPKISVYGTAVASSMGSERDGAVFTVQKLYRLAENANKYAYAAVCAQGTDRDRRAYTIEEKEENVLMSNGAVTLDVPTDALLELLSLALVKEAKQQETANIHEYMAEKFSSNS